jgi:hypothetical protein
MADIPKLVYQRGSSRAGLIAEVQAERIGDADLMSAYGKSNQTISLTGRSVRPAAYGRYLPVAPQT